MRIGELLNLKVYDARLSEQKALIREGEKNSVGRVVCLSVDALLALSQWNIIEKYTLFNGSMVRYLITLYRKEKKGYDIIFISKNQISL